MIEKDDVKHLAELSRLDFSDKEISSFKNDLDSILSYVDQIKEISASVDLDSRVGPVHNVLREDGNPYEDGEHREEIIESFPEKEGDYLKVKKILL